MQRQTTPRGGERVPASPRRRAARPPLNTGPRVPWTHIPVERLDLDQFADDGYLLAGPYRPATTSTGGGR